MRGREEGLIPLVVRTGEDGAPVKEDLDDLVVVRVRRQDQRGDVRGEGRCVGGNCLPTLIVTIIIIMTRMMKMKAKMKGEMSVLSWRMVILGMIRMMIRRRVIYI